MPFAYPKRKNLLLSDPEALRKAAREDRIIEETRSAWEREHAEKVLFHAARGMSEATLIAKFGRELVLRVLESRRTRPA